MLEEKEQVETEPQRVEVVRLLHVQLQAMEEDTVRSRIWENIGQASERIRRCES